MARRINKREQLRNVNNVLRPLGVSVRYSSEYNEYSANFIGGKEATRSYHADDLDDAYNTALAMARHKTQHLKRNPLTGTTRGEILERERMLAHLYNEGHLSTSGKAELNTLRGKLRKMGGEYLAVNPKGKGRARTRKKHHGTMSRIRRKGLYSGGKTRQRKRTIRKRIEKHIKVTQLTANPTRKTPRRWLISAALHGKKFIMYLNHRRSAFTDNLSAGEYGAARFYSAREANAVARKLLTLHKVPLQIRYLKVVRE
jgi:hypothetical protein